MEHLHTVHVYVMHEYIYIHVRLATPMNGSPMRARRTHAPTCCVCVRARVRVRLGARASVPTHASALPSASTAMARPAGVLVGVGVQREHRRVEHRGRHLVVLGMRRPFGPGGAPPQAGRARKVSDAARAVVRGGTADARARACAQTCAHAHARVSTCVGIAARSKDRLYACMNIHAYIYMHYTYVHRYCVLV
jgi:hypothetical protein